MDSNEWQGVTHHLMGNVDLGERFTVFDFVNRADKIIKDIHRRGHRAIICGGTGLYIRAMTDGIFEIPEDDFSYRSDLLDLVSRDGPSSVHNMLLEIDPEEAARVHPHNFVKVIRALEIYQLTGRTKTELAETTRPKNRRLNFLQIILKPDRDNLYKKIEDRVDNMVKAGLVEEAREVYNSDYREKLTSCKIVGYSELLQHFNGQISLNEALNLIKQNTRRFAKRQFTWFMAVKNAEILTGFGSNNIESCFKMVETFWSKPASD